jgi:hypothetical protein
MLAVLFETVCCQLLEQRLRWSTGSVLAFGSRVQTRPKLSDFSGRKNPHHAFLRGKVKVCPTPQIFGM